MKYYILIICISLITSYAEAQEKFTGIGIFKIGSDTNVVYAYAKANKLKLIISNSSDPVFMKERGYSYVPNELYRLVPNKNSAVINMSYSPETQEFYLSNYEVAGIMIKNIRLVYYKGNLIRFKCQRSDEIKAAMNTKYGEPTLITKKDTSYCRYNSTGISTPLIGATYTSVWSGDNVTAEDMIKKYYNDNCKESFVSSFSYVGDDSELRKQETEIRLKRLDELLHPKTDKSKIKDF